MIALTDKAVSKVKELFASDPESKGKALRVAVQPGGCSGYEYAMMFDEKRAGDSEVAYEGVTVIVDEKSLQFLTDSKIDYLDDPMQAGFKIQNPKVKSTCGCGKSNQF
jgi:iron-sulfur cluster assembly accessory protein